MKKLLVAAMLAMVGGAVSADTIAYWPFGAKGLKDVSGNGNHLESDGVHVDIENDDNCATFDGAQTLFSTINAIDVGSAEALTLEFWIKFDRAMAIANASPFIIFEWSENFNSYDYAFLFDYNEMNSTMLGAWKVTNGYLMSNQNGDTTGDNAWHHVAMILNPKESGNNCCKLYVDGNEYIGGTGYNTPPQSTITWPSGQKVYIGSRANNSYKFLGQIDDVRISSGALDKSEFLARSSDAMPVLPYPAFGSVAVKDATTNSITIAGNVSSIGDGAAECGVYAAYDIGEGMVTNEVTTLTEAGDFEFALEDLAEATKFNFTFLLKNDIYPNYIKFPISAQTLEKTQTIAYYSFDDEDVSVGTGNGHDELIDKSGNGWTMWMLGVSVKNGAAKLSGNQTYFTPADWLYNRINYSNYLPQPQGRDHLTIELWAKFNAADNPGTSMLFETSGNCGYEGNCFNLYYTDNRLEATVAYDGNYNYNIGAASFVPDGEWHHFALVICPNVNAVAFDGVYSEPVAFIYIDGKVAGQILWNHRNWDAERYCGVIFTNPPLYIGARANTQYPLVGEIDDFRISAGALQPNQFVERTPIEDAVYPEPEIEKITTDDFDETWAELTVSVPSIGDGATKFDLWATWEAAGETKRVDIVQNGTSSGEYSFKVEGLTEATAYAVTVTIKNDIYDDPVSMTKQIATKEAAKAKAYWSFNGEPFAGSGGGGALYFTDDTGNYALIVDGVTFASGAACFDGTLGNVRPSDWQYGRINFGNIVYPTITQATIEGWARFKADDNAGQVVLFGVGDIGCYSAPTALVWYDGINKKMAVSMCYETNFDGQSYVTDFEADGKWHHFALVIEMNEVTRNAASLYIDFEKAMDIPWRFDGSRYHNFALGNPDFHIGSSFTGQIDDVRVYNRALAPEQFIQKRTKGYNPFMLIIR